MKYLYTLIIITFLGLEISAQARMTGNNLSVGSLTAASEKLEVFGDAQITGENPFLRFKLPDATPDPGDESGLHWRNSTNATNMRMLYSWLDNRLYILPDTDQNLAHLTVENATGHVGINVRDPQEQLHVIGKMFITDDIRFDGSEYLQWEESGVRKSYVRYTGIDLQIENDEDGGWIVIDADEDIRFNTADIQKMAIKEDGRVGIGTNLPADKVHVLAGVGEGITIERTGAAIVEIKADDPGSIGTSSNHPFRLVTNSAVRMQVNTNGNVGVGTINPAEKLQVNGAVRLGTTTGTNNGTIRYTGSDFEGRVGGSWESLTSGGGGSSVWSTSGSNTFFNSGNVGIGTSSPAHKLQINGDIGMTGEIVGVSDVRTKKNIESLPSSTEIINQLRPVSYDFNTEEYDMLQLPSGKQYGFLAQEVEDILPELVKTSAIAGDQELSGINYMQMIPILTKAIQDQGQLIENQQKQIDELKSLINDISSK